MRFKSVLRKLVTAAFFAFTVFSILATSKPGDNPFGGNFFMFSDCVTPVRAEQVTVVASQITAPGGVSFTDFGFPSATVVRDVVGTVGGKSRSCRITYGDPDNLNFSSQHPTIYSCFDDGAFTCTITMNP